MAKFRLYVDRRYSLCCTIFSCRRLTQDAEYKRTGPSVYWIKIFSLFKMKNIRPRPVFDDKSASNNGPESIAKQRISEKYPFLDDGDLKTFFYKKRTLTSSEFADYLRNLDMIKRVTQINLRDSKSRKEFESDSSRAHVLKSYKQKRVVHDVEPQSSSFNPFGVFLDPFGIKKMSDQIPVVVETISEKLPDSSERREFLDFLKGVQGKIPGFSIPVGSEALETASNVLQGFSVLSPSVLVAIGASWYAHSQDWPSLAFFLGCCVYLVIKTPEQLTYLIKLYMNIFDKIPTCPDIDMESVSPQSFDMANLELIGSTVAISLIGMVGLKSKVTGAALALAFVKDFSRARLGMIELSKVVLSFVEKIVNFFREECLSLPSVKFLNACSKEIDQFSQQVRLLSFQFNRGSLVMNEDSYSKVLCLLDIGKHLQKTIPKDKFSESSLRYLHEDCNNLKKIITQMEQCDVSLKGLRQEPVGILLSGGPGVAKSIAHLYLGYLLTRSVLNGIAELQEFEANPGGYIFSRKIENVFWDGYSNKCKTVIYDDFMQNRDVAGTASEAMEIIRVINTEEYNAHMAHLENKGNVYIRPRFVIGTTNQTRLTSNAIILMDAVKRRFGQSYLVVPKEKYTMDDDIEENRDYWHRRLDRSKLPKKEVLGLDDEAVAGSIISDLRPEYLDYYELNLLNNQIGERISFDEVVRRAHEAELINRRRFALHKENFRKIVKEYSKIFEIAIEEEKLDDNYSFDPQSEDMELDSDDDSDYTFIDSSDATDDMRHEIEFLLLTHPDYRSYLYRNVRGTWSTTIDELITILLDNLGYHKAIELIMTERKLQEGEFLKKKNPSLVVRAFVSVNNVVNYFLSFLPAWKTVSAFLISNYENIVMILAFVAGSSMLVHLAKWLYSWWTGKPAPESFGFSDKMRSQKKVNPIFVKGGHEAMRTFLAQPQFGEDSSGVDMIHSTVRRSCFKVETLSNADVWTLLSSLTFISGRIAIFNYHSLIKLMTGIEDDPTIRKRVIRLSHGDDKQNPGFLFTLDELLNNYKVGCLKAKDLVLIEFPKRFPERPSIIDRFALRKDLEHCSRNLEICLATTRGMSYGRGHRFMDIVGIKDKIPGYDYVIEETFIYEIPTIAGDCGSLMCILNPSIPKRKIFGIHVAGHTYHGDGFAAVVTQEEILEDMKMFDTPIISEEPVFMEPQSTDLDMPLRFEIIGRTNASPQRNLSSEIRKSKMYGALGDNELDRAMLRRTLVCGTLVDPLLNAQQKYCRPDVLLDNRSLQQACKSYFAYCEWVSTFEVERRIYDCSEAIYGLEYDADFGSVNSSSSAGYPMNVIGERNLKKELFSYCFGSHDQIIVYDEVQAKVNEILDKARKNIRMFHVCTDNLKDELRDLVKVLAGSTRLFSGAPFIYLIAFRMYFGAFSLWYMKNRINNGSAIGVNCYSSEWNSIAMRLIEKNINNIGDGDYEKYDGSQKPTVHLFILDDINIWYDDGQENFNVRSILWMEVYNSRHIVDGVIYEWMSGLPSGHPFTIIINTIYNHINARYTWIKEMGTIVGYNENVYAISQGDDLAYAVTDEYRDKFNDYKIHERVKEVGMTYTASDKSGEIKPLKSLTHITFLKRAFVFDPRENLWIAPLVLKSILKMVDWTKRKQRNKIVADNVIIALKELSLHDRYVFDDYSVKIRREFKHHYPFLHTSEPLDMDYWDVRTRVLATQQFF